MIATRNMLVAGILAVVAGLVVGVLGTGYVAWSIAVVALVFVGLVDAFWVSRRPEPTMRRVVDNSLALGVEADVEIVVTLPDGEGGTIEVFDGVPPELGADSPSLTADIEPGKRLRATYVVVPWRRGTHYFERAYVRQSGPLGLVARQLRIGDEESVRVLPNFRAVSQYALMGLADDLNELGVHQLRRRGEGMEFDSLREYRPGDQLRQIDWKATARHRRVIARQYEDERHQQVILVFDCGRRMRARGGELSHFDHALNAGLLLSYVALERGDSVSVGTFGGVDRWVPGRRGPSAVEGIVEQTFDLETTTEPSDFSAVAQKLAQRQKRRALIIFLTNLYDAAPDELERALGVLSQRHLVLVASLREAAVEQLTDVDVRTHDDALQVGATHHFLEQRRQVHAELDRAGARLLDTTPAELSVGLVNKYLEIKKSGKL